MKNRKEQKKEEEDEEERESWDFCGDDDVDDESDLWDFWLDQSRISAFLLCDEGFILILLGAQTKFRFRLFLLKRRKFPIPCLLFLSFSHWFVLLWSVHRFGIYWICLYFQLISLNPFQRIFIYLLLFSFLFYISQRKMYLSLSVCF